MTGIAIDHQLRIFTAARLGERDNLATLLDAFAAAKLEPTHAGEREYSVAAAGRADILAAVVDRRQHVLSLARRKAPRYTGTLGAPDSGLATITIEFGATATPELIYGLGDRLAERFRAAYGVVHPDVRDGTRFRGPGVIELGWLQSFGPIGIAARNWFGAHLVALIGEDRIRAAGVATPLPWGGLRLDLVESPWAADIATLKQRQAEAVAEIASAQVLGDYSHPVTYKPGARWVPIPEPSSIAAALRAAIDRGAMLDRFDLQRADLTGVDLARLRVTALQGEGARLDRARLTGAQLLEADLGRASLIDANLDGANLASARLDDANLMGATLRRAMFTIASCQRADLTQADLTGADLSGTLFSQARLSSAILAQAIARYTQLARCALDGADLHGGCFASAVFAGADLREADLHGADLTEADLRGADLRDADLRGTELAGARFDSARLDGARLDGTSLASSPR